MANKLFNITIDLSDDRVKNLSSITEDLININYMGSLLSKNNYDFKFEQTSFFANSIGKLKTPNETDITGKSFYRHSDINLPRDKFDVLKEKYSCKIVKDSQQADYQIISLNSLSSYVTRTGYEKLINKPNVTLDRLKNDQQVIDMFHPDAYVKLMSFFESINKDDVVVIDLLPRYGYNKLSFGAQLNTLINNITTYSSAVYISDENANILTDMINKGNLVLDSHMYSFADKHMTTLNEEDYKNLVKMINASADDLELAVNIMANSNMKASYDKIAMLCYFFGIKMKEARSYNSAGFKVLRKAFSHYFTGPALSHPHAYNYFINRLSSDKALTEFAFKQSVSLFFDHVVSTMLGHNKEERAFTIDIDAIKLSPKYQGLFTKTIGEQNGI